MVQSLGLFQRFSDALPQATIDPTMPAAFLASPTQIYEAAAEMFEVDRSVEVLSPHVD